MKKRTWAALTVWLGGIYLTLGGPAGYAAQRRWLPPDAYLAVFGPARWVYSATPLSPWEL